MKPGLIVCLLIVLGVSCRNSNTKEGSNTSSPKQAVLGKNMSVQLLKRSLVDSVKRLGHLSEAVLKDNNYQVYLRELNGDKVAIITIYDSMLFLLQQNMGGYWSLTDSTKFNDYIRSVDIKDLNGDSKDDLLVYGIPNMHGNRVPYVFISDADGTQHYRSDIHLWNIDYDNNKKLVTSYYQGGVTSINDKEYYKWEGDSLMLVQGVEQNNSTDARQPVIFYTFKNGKWFDYKKLVDNTGAIYDTALWKQY